MSNKALLNNKKNIGKIFVTYHKRFPILSGDFIVPIHVGRSSSNITKDGAIDDKDNEWMINNLIGDDTGDNISVRNREFSECTGLYWFWKNYDFKNLDYVGCFQYRRQLILNNYYDKAFMNREKKVYKCVHMKGSEDICNKIGVNNERIKELLNVYDYILPKRTSLEKIHIKSVYEDYLKKIPGVHISDLFILEDVFCEKYPDERSDFKEYLNSPHKLMYQIFIMSPKEMDNYCKWLFDILFEVDKRVDASLYSVNGKRTMGYLAEILYGYYFTVPKRQERALNVGVTFLE